MQFIQRLIKPRAISLTEMILSQDSFFDDPIKSLKYLNTFLSKIPKGINSEITANARYFARIDHEEENILNLSFPQDLKQLIVSELIIVGYELGNTYQANCYDIARVLFTKNIFENRDDLTDLEIRFVKFFMGMGAELKDFDPNELSKKDREM